MTDLPAEGGVSRRARLGMGDGHRGRRDRRGSVSALPHPPPRPRSLADATAAVEAGARELSRAHRSTARSTRTLLHGTPGANGYRKVVVGAGEPSHPAPRPARRRDPRHRYAHARCVAFGQLTDMHIIDAQSPARVEFLDRLNDPGSPLASVVAVLSPPTAPQEMLTAHVAEAMVQAVNALRRRRRSPGRRSTSRQHRRQLRQHPVQRGALAHRPARRRTVDPSRLRRPTPSGKASAAPTTSTRLLAPGRHAARRPDRQLPHATVRLPDRAGPARPLPRTVPRHRPAHALVRGRSATTTAWCRATSRGDAAINAIATGPVEGHRPADGRQPRRAARRLAGRRLRRRCRRCSVRARRRSSPPTRTAAC